MNRDGRAPPCREHADEGEQGEKDRRDRVIARASMIFTTCQASAPQHDRFGGEPSVTNRSMNSTRRHHLSTDRR